VTAGGGRAVSEPYYSQRARRVCVSLSAFFICFFRLDALAKALSVIATATWLGGWVADWLRVRHTPVLYQNG